MLTTDLYFQTKKRYNLCKKTVDIHVKYYKEFECRPIIAECCEKSILWSKISIVVKFLTIAVFPIFVHFLSSNGETFLVLYIPGIDIKKRSGFFILNFCQIIDVCFATIGLVFYETQIVTIAANMECMGNILILKMKQANESNELLDKSLNDLIVFYTEFVEYVKDFDVAYKNVVTFKFLTAGLNITFALFCVQIVSFSYLSISKFKFLNIFLDRLECWIFHNFWNYL